MTALAVLAYALLTLAAAIAIAAPLRPAVTLPERCLIGIAASLILGTLLAYAVALLLGVNAFSALLGPLLLLGIAAVVAIRCSWLDNWRQALVTLREDSDQLRSSVMISAVVAVALAIFSIVAGRAVVTAPDGSIIAGYQTVWSDWSQHLTTANSFAVAQNLPPHDPLFAGAPLRYPFLPDFQAALLIGLGVSAPAALAAGSAVMLTLAAALVVVLAQRLHLGIGTGVIAAVICFIGGGIGFVTFFGDACQSAGYSASQCALSSVWHSPGVLVGAFGHIPDALSHQTRAYDGLLTDVTQQPITNTQWYTPLLAWWLPQRTFVWGFVLALSVLVIVLGALDAEPRGAWHAFALAGVLCGTALVVHVQTAMVLAIVLGVMALSRRRLEWTALIGLGLAVGLWRVIALAGAPRGTQAAQNTFPFFEAGWKWNALDLAHEGAGAPVVHRGVLGTAWAYFAFWLRNLVLAVPLSLAVALAAGVALIPAGWRSWGQRIVDFFGRELVRFVLPFVLIFVLCNTVVLQSWDWDNTKLLAYWYLAAALLIARLAVGLVRWWWGIPLSVLTVAATTLTGVIVVIRMLPGTPAQDSITGPYTVASAADATLARTVASSTPHDAVFLTPGRPNDPILAVAGRTAVMAYYGWLWSYGTDFGSRVTDEQTIYAGCGVTTQPQNAQCRQTLRGLIHRYGISYVEVDDRTGDPGVIQPQTDFAWWSQQGFPVVAHDEDITIYDVRSA